MIKLSRTVAYAIQATLQLAQAESTTPVPCSRIASQGEMPERFLLQILRNLVTHGILQSTRGVDGGYTLVRPASEISILEVIEAIEGPLATDSVSASGLDDETRENLRVALNNVAETARRQLESVKLSQIVTSGPSDTTPRDATSANTTPPSAAPSNSESSPVAEPNGQNPTS
ncbi:MAG: Rrf2 family transcriptional regulator [Planctomycetales bacterium]|nr:Rrf2 family transcriptional regulator [Planctomycetales bacterium]